VTFADRRWRVVGILQEAGVTKLDTLDNLVVLPLASAQVVFDAEGLISAVLLTANDVNRTTDIAAQEIGTLRAIGARRRRIVGLVFMEVLILSLAGGIPGAILTHNPEVASQAGRVLRLRDGQLC